MQKLAIVLLSSEQALVVIRLTEVRATGQW